MDELGAWTKFIAEAGILPAMFAFVLRWMMTRFERDLQRLGEKQQKAAKASTAQALMIVELQKQVLAHDLSMTGIDPADEMLPDTARMALKKYTEVVESLTQVEQALRALVE